MKFKLYSKYLPNPPNHQPFPKHQIRRPHHNFASLIYTHNQDYPNFLSAQTNPSYAKHIL